MLPKPSSLTGIGLVQVLLASTFVVWLAFFPSRGVDFAWPVTPELSAVFIGTAFVARAYLGFHLWREKYWWRLRWQVWGNLGFLTVVFLTTFWHVHEINWATNIIIAHVWVVAYAVEPLLLIVLEPRGEAASAPLPQDLREGPILPGLNRMLLVLYIFLTTLAGVFLLNPEFAATRWPWELTAFDARIMSAFFVLGALWALRVRYLDDWAEAKLAVRGLIILGLSLLIAYALTVSHYGPTNREVYGVIIAVSTLIALYYYWRQEQQKEEFRHETSSDAAPPGKIE